jgi:hypothetical protein
VNEVDELLLEHFHLNVEDLEHAGVKGMKWGVRRERRNQALARSGQRIRGGGGGHVSSRLRSTARIGPVDFVRGRGLRGASERKAVRVGAQLERRKKGQSTTLDLVKRFGSTRITDLVPVRDTNANKKTSHKSDIAIVTAAGALIALRILSKSAARRI